MKLRTFIAVEVDSALRSALAEIQQQLRPYAPDVKWVETENLHLTLKFLGDVDEAAMGDVVNAVERCAASSPAFVLNVVGCGAFPNLRNPRVIVAHGREPTDALADLHRTLEAALADLGFKRERRAFKPHLTIGRVRRRSPGRVFSEQLEARSHVAQGEQHVSAVAVMTSELTPTGPLYTRVAEARLGDGSH